MAKKKGRFLNFFKDVKGELKKVTWPSFKQVRNNTLIVIICVLIIGAFIWLLDFAFAKGWTWITPNTEQTQTVETTDTGVPADTNTQQ